MRNSIVDFFGPIFPRFFSSSSTAASSTLSRIFTTLRPMTPTYVAYRHFSHVPSSSSSSSSRTTFCHRNDCPVGSVRSKLKSSFPASNDRHLILPSFISLSSCRRRRRFREVVVVKVVFSPLPLAGGGMSSPTSRRRRRPLKVKHVLCCKGRRQSRRSIF